MLWYYEHEDEIEDEHEDEIDFWRYIIVNFKYIIINNILIQSNIIILLIMKIDYYIHMTLSINNNYEYKINTPPYNEYNIRR